ncbi:zinc finger, CCHC-type containing protein, partial [Tanacetum coccineum]
PAGPPDLETADPDTIDKYYDVNLEQELAKQELFETIKAFYACKQEEGQSVSSYLLKMKSYLDTLERLGYAMPNKRGVFQRRLKLPLYLLYKRVRSIRIGKTATAKGKDKGKNMLTYAPKHKIPPPPKREHPAKDYVCHRHKKVGHWKMNCPFYQAELKKRKSASIASTSGCGTHIYNTSQGLRESRMLKHGALSLYIGNGMRVAVEAVGSFD